MKHQFSLTCNYVLILVSVLVFPREGFSAPHRERILGLTSRDYVLSDSEYGQVLDRLQRESNESIASDPRNFVNNDVSIEELVRMIENATTYNPNPLNGYVTTETSIGFIIANTSEIPDIATTMKEDISIDNSVSTPRVFEQASTTETSLSAPSTEATTATQDCPICLEPINSEPSELTPCAHKFHSNCLRKWEIMHGNGGIKCPLCRSQIGYRYHDRRGTY